MICPECNTKNKKDAKKCTNCGARLVENDETNVVHTKDKIIIKPRRKNNLNERAVEEVIGQFETVENNNAEVEVNLEESEVLDIPEVVETPVEVVAENTEPVSDIPDTLTVDNSLSESSPLDNIDSIQIDESLSTLEVPSEEPQVEQESTEQVVETEPVIKEEKKTEPEKVEEKKTVENNKKSSYFPYFVVGGILLILLLIVIILIIYTKKA